MAVATSVTESALPDDGGGLGGVLRTLRGVDPSPAAPSCCTWVCRSVVVDVHDRHRADAGPGPDLRPVDLEFEAVLAARLARRYLATVRDAQAGRPVAQAWQLLLARPAAPSRLALAGVRTLLDYDLTLAFVGAATVLGRTPDRRERAAHHRVAALLGTCVRELVRRTGDPVPMAAAGRLDSLAARDAAWRRAEQLWAVRGRPAEAEAARVALDRAVRAEVAHLLGT